MDTFANRPIGSLLDGEVCRRVFGLPEWKICFLRLFGLLPRYPTSWSAATRITPHFYGLPPESVLVLRYNEWLCRLGAMNSKRGAIGAVVIGSCPSNVCDAALFAVLNEEAN